MNDFLFARLQMAMSLVFYIIFAAILFAVGAVSGTVISFELGLLWPKFMAYAGSNNAVLNIPLTLMLVVIVLHGAAFVFRAYGIQSAAARRSWERVFAIAGAYTPLMLGVVLGATISDAFRVNLTNGEVLRGVCRSKRRSYKRDNLLKKVI